MMRSMNSHAADELHALRARAYGPDADIHDDDEALWHLEELEALAGQRLVEQPQEVEGLDAAASSSADDELIDPDPSEDSAPLVTAPPRGRRRLVLWWIASLLVAVVATAVVTGIVSKRVQADPRQVATLGVDLGIGFPRFLGLQNQDGRVFTPFHGLLPVASTGGWMGSNDDQCLAVMESTKVVADADSYGGPIFFGCAAGSFPATVQIKVGADSPQELQDAFPRGTALQFVLGPTEVTVLIDEGLVAAAQ